MEIIDNYVNDDYKETCKQFMVEYFVKHLYMPSAKLLAEHITNKSMHELYKVIDALKEDGFLIKPSTKTYALNKNNNEVRSMLREKLK